jgi:hypothetical protein
MAITQAFCNQAKLDFINGVIQPGDTFRIALYTSAATLDATTLVYTATSEAVGAGYVAKGLLLAGFSSSLTSGVANINWTNPTIPTASLTARGAMIYCETRASRSIAIIDFGADYTATSGSFTINLPTPGNSGIVRIG